MFYRFQTSVAVVFLLLICIGCGHGRLQVRPGSVQQCVQAHRPALLKSPVVGWASTPSLNAWIDKIDEIGHRMSIFAPKVSFRKVAEARIARRMTINGIKGSDWLSLQAPMHAILQRPAAGKQFNISIVTHATSNAEFLDAFAAIRSEEPAKGWGFTVEPRRKRKRNRNRKALPVWVELTEQAVAIFSFKPNIASALKPLGICAASKRTSHLLEVGMDATEIKEMSTAALRFIGRFARRFSPIGGAINGFGKQASEALAQSSWLKLALDFDDESISLGGTLVAKPGSKLQKEWRRKAQTPANRHLGQLPADSWFVSLDNTDDQQPPLWIIKLLENRLPGPLKQAFTPMVKAVADMKFGQTATALFVEGQFPLSLYVVSEIENPRSIIETFDQSLRRLAKLQQAKDKAKTGRKGSDLTQLVHDEGFTGLVKVLNRQMAKRGMSLSMRSLSKGEQRCDILTIKGILQIPAARKLPRGTLADSFDLGLCTEGKTIRIALSPEAAKWLPSRSNKGPSASADNAKWLSAETQMTDARVSSLMVLYPKMLIDWFSRLIPTLPRWESGAAFVGRCGHNTSSARCELKVNLDLIEAIQSARAALSRRK